MRLAPAIRRLTLAAILAAAPLSAAHAEQYLTLGAGWFNFNRSTQNSTNFMGEWRGDSYFTGFRPVIGGQINTDGGALGYFGIDYDWEVIPHWIITPGLAVGAWRDGSSVDLGGWFEFHESIEVDYKFDNDYRIGGQVSHTSNAHIYDRNPGANSVMGTLSIPLGN